MTWAQVGRLTNWATQVPQWCKFEVDNMMIWYVQQSTFSSGLKGQTEDPKKQEELYRTLHPATSKHTFFSRVQGAFSTTGHVRNHRVSLKKFKISEMIQSICYGQNGMKLQTRRKQKENWKFYKSLEINNTLLTNHWVKEEITRETRNSLRWMKTETLTHQNLRDAAESSAKQDTYSYKTAIFKKKVDVKSVI